MIQKYEKERNYSHKQLQELVDWLNSATMNSYKELGNGLEIVKEYGVFYLWRKQEKFSYKLDEVKYFSSPWFTIASEGKRIEGVTLKDEDFPITIRPWQKSDEIELRYGHKKVSRYLIDNKVYRKDRYYWPVVCDKNGRVIFVCGIGCDIIHFSIQPSLFVLK